MANTLTWSNGAAPIDVADLEMIGTAAMGHRHFGWRRMRVLLATTELPDLARVPLDLGLEVVDVTVDGYADTPEPRPGPVNVDILDPVDLNPDHHTWDHLDPDRTELGGPDDGTDVGGPEL
ncbi:hypothetical protein ACIQVK_40470 [Streptomyces sp. NPDC090493]